jgi:hypothetical protein
MPAMPADVPAAIPAAAGVTDGRARRADQGAGFDLPAHRALAFPLSLRLYPASPARLRAGGCFVCKAGVNMQPLLRLIHLVAIVLSAAATGLGALAVLDHFHVFHPYKGLFYLLGILTAVIAGLGFLRLWPCRRIRPKTNRVA